MNHIDDLSRLREQLGELLTLLEDDRADPAALSRVMQSCGVVFEALKAGFPAEDELEPQDQERLTDALETTLRLNAVALSRATAAGEDLARGISEAKLARKHASALIGEAPSGAAYDLSV